MRECIEIIDDKTVEVKKHKYHVGRNSLVYTLKCLVEEFDALKFEYNKLKERYDRVLKLQETEGATYVLSLADLAKAIEMDKSRLLQVVSRAEFDKFRTFITEPRQAMAFIVNKKSLQLLYTFLVQKTSIQFSDYEFKKLFLEVANGQSR